MSMKLLGEVVTAVADPEALNNPAVVELVTVVVNVCAEVHMCGVIEESCRGKALNSGWL